MASEPGPHEQRFREWWKQTPGFDLCTLRQAIGSYCASYPGRVLPLLEELLRTPDDPEEDGPPRQSRAFFQE